MDNASENNDVKRVIAADTYIIYPINARCLITTLIVKNPGTISIIIVLVTLIPLASFLLPITAHSQIPYLPNAQRAEKNQGNQEDSITARNESNNSIPSNSGYASSRNASKVVIINFDDSHKSQYEYAKPILDKYGFKRVIK